MTTVRLSPEYDVAKLQEALLVLGGQRYFPQRTYSEGKITETLTDGWRILPLRSPGGDPNRTDPGGPGLVDYADTPSLAEVPYLASIMAGLNTQLRAVRLMSLEAGATVEEHRDYPYGLPVGWVRLHAPIVTNDGAVLVVGGVENRWRPGGLYYADFGLPHSVRNTGDTARVHLVLDCFVTAGLLAQFPADFRAGLDEAETMLVRPARPIEHPRLQGFTGPIPVPAAFVATYEQAPTIAEFEDSAAADTKGHLRIDEEGRLVLAIDDGLESALVHIGGDEFRFLCWTEERTLAFEQRDGRTELVFRYRHGSRRAEIRRSA